MKYLWILFLALSTSISFAEELKYTCNTIVSVCEKKDSNVIYPLCENNESLLTEQVILTCPEAKSSELVLKKFSFNKKLQLIYSCGDDQTLKIVLNEVITEKIGRVLNLATAPISTDFLQLFSTLIEDNPPGDKRVIFDLSCVRSVN